jgi:hypothetical protein
MKIALLEIALMLVIVAPACSPTYPKEKLGQSIRELFKKEVGTEDVLHKVAGRTLYVSFPIENMVSPTLDLPKDVLEKIEDAMISIARIGMSTDESLDFIILNARDNTWGVETTLVRRIEDLKFLYYMKISKTDFDERFILETKNFDLEKDPPERDWNGMTLQEYMARWVAFRIGLGSQSNPFLNVLMGIHKVSFAYDSAKLALTLQVDGSNSGLQEQFLKAAVFEQMKKAETKYLSRLPKGESWAQTLRVEDNKGGLIFSADRGEWIKDETKNTDR